MNLKAFAHKKHEIMPFAATLMDLEIIILREVSQRKKNIIWYQLCVESKKKNDTDELIYKTYSQTMETNLWLPKWNKLGVKLGIN